MGNRYGYALVRGGTWDQLWSVSSDSKQAIDHSRSYSRDNIRVRYKLEELDLAKIEGALPFLISTPSKHH